MLDKTKLTKYLRDSLLLTDPNVTSDPAFQYSDDDLWDIVSVSVSAHNPLYTIDTIPDGEVYFVILLSKKEVYIRLATSSAPFYPIKAEGAELRKDYRFEHYMSLVRNVDSEYDSKLDKFNHDKPIEVGEVIIQGKHNSLRGYNNAKVPVASLQVVTTRTDSVDIQWSEFAVFGGIFLRYTLYLSESPIYDEFEYSISDQAELVADIRDIHRTKYRLKELKPNTLYYILLVLEDSNTLKGYSEVTTTTLDVVTP